MTYHNSVVLSTPQISGTCPSRQARGELVTRLTEDGRLKTNKLKRVLKFKGGPKDIFPWVT